MAYKAILQSISNNGASADVMVEFYASEKDSITKGYSIHPDQFPTLQSFKDFIKIEAKKLDDFASTTDSIDSLLGEDIF